MGRHSAPDDYDDNDAAVLSAPPSSADRPLPGRHSGGERPRPDADSGPAGLDIIETVMAGGDDRESRDTSGVPAAADPAAEGNTAQIEPIADPVLDEPLPFAVTTQLRPVVDGETPPPRPSPQAPDDIHPTPGPAAGSSDAEADAEAAKAAKAEAKAAKAADTAAAKERKAAAKAAAKEQSRAAKAAKQAGEPDATPTAKGKPSRPEPRVSDLALLRRDSAARARVLAAIIVPFVLYVAVLLVIGEFDLRTVLIWIWLPLISAGIVAGLLLDLAHRAAAARAIVDLEKAREPAA